MSDAVDVVGRTLCVVGREVSAPIPIAICAAGHRVWWNYWLACDYRQGEPSPVAAEVATFATEFQAVASGRAASRPARLPTRAPRAFAEVAIGASLQRTP